MCSAPSVQVTVSLVWSSKQASFRGVLDERQEQVDGVGATRVEQQGRRRLRKVTSVTNDGQDDEQDTTTPGPVNEGITRWKSKPVGQWRLVARQDEPELVAGKCARVDE
ncbi:hypothetical protein PC128_g17531 [Phytophthora cactorum]|nr:hypothetical protein PC120_g5083 [Phytophthora cactorum]KAG3096354.1 hypothetical protein PC121_g2538 [Phytophthora cactorum]KAG3175884.1 hypothetical protein PC128_g17531 [Phytophthora cactorum]KAG4059875.1 hypothetical protein PC123_g5211 [Phytophthora cactorum]